MASEETISMRQCGISQFSRGPVANRRTLEGSNLYQGNKLKRLQNQGKLTFVCSIVFLFVCFAFF